VDTPFPCPFCRSGCVVLVGAGRHFLHYRCASCAEVWTAQSAAPFGAHTHTVLEALPALTLKEKVLLN
jgi:transposase-like protein